MESDGEKLPVFNGPDTLIAAVAQDALSGEVLMLAWMNRDAWEATLREGIAVYWSRSRKALWRKGERSGNTQVIKEILVDCDGDAVLLKVHQKGGAACHTGRRSCFFRKIEGDGIRIVLNPVFDPETVYGAE
jgi:phosphoribosyl-AMP cyclohydrolase